MNSLRPTLPVKINNRDAKFVLDSGAFYSMMSSATAAEYNLKLSPAPFGFTVMGIGGSTGASVATVKEFTIVGITVKNVEFLVGESEVAAYAGLLGQNLLERFDVEYDLASGAIRLPAHHRSRVRQWATNTRGVRHRRVHVVAFRQRRASINRYDALPGSRRQAGQDIRGDEAVRHGDA